MRSGASCAAQFRETRFGVSGSNHDTMNEPQLNAPSSTKRAPIPSGVEGRGRTEPSIRRRALGKRPPDRRRPSLFRGETLGALRRDLGVTPSELAGLRNEVLAGMQNNHQMRGPDHRNRCIHDPKTGFSDQAAQIAPPEDDRDPEDWTPPAAAEAEAVSLTMSPSASPPSSAMSTAASLPSVASETRAVSWHSVEPDIRLPA